jgi:hypothetical protein
VANRRWGRFFFREDAQAVRGLRGVCFRRVCGYDSRSMSKNNEYRIREDVIRNEDGPHESKAAGVNPTPRGHIRGLSKHTYIEMDSP